MISVVIPTFNKPDLLRQTLAALESDAVSLRERCEIVVVDDGSDGDATRGVIEEFSARIPLVDASAPRNEGRARARNRGWRAARGRWVLFLDDDIRLRRGALRAHLMAQESEEAVWMGAVVTAPEIVDSVLFDYLDSRGTAKLRAGENPPARYLLTQNVSIPRRALEGIDGFDEDFGAYGFEDMELGFRLEDQAGCAFRYLGESVGEHVHHHTLGEYLEKKRVCGESTLPRLAQLHPARLAEMRLDLLPGIGKEQRLGQALELSWRCGITPAVRAIVRIWPRGWFEPVVFGALDYLVLAAYRDGLRRRLS
jgi:glycosyltransferase involved in cell wall biosynthesis